MLDMLVEGIGQLRMLARIKGRFATKNKAQLQPFSEMLIRFSGQGDLKYLNEFELTSPPCSLKGKALYCGFYLNELCNRLLSVNEPFEHLFTLYHQHLFLLASDHDFEPALRSFEFQLLEALGVGIDFGYDIEGNELDENAFYQYQNELGWIKLATTQRGLRGAQIQQIASLDFTDKTTRQLAKQLARYLLHPLLGYRELKSRELFA